MEPEPTSASETGLRVLFLVHRFPYPPDKGDRIRSYNLLRFLASRYEVHLACLADEPVSAASQRFVEEACQQVCVVPLHSRWRWVNAAWSVMRGRTATEGLFRSAKLERALNQWCREIRFDAIVVFCSSVAPYLDRQDFRAIPTIVDLVDVDSQKWLDYASKSGWVGRQLFQLEGHRLRRLESHLAESCQAVTVVSEAEADLLRSVTHSDRVVAVANGVDLEYFQPSRSMPTSQAAQGQHVKRCTFVGALDYRANIDGVTWFCDEVWPEIHRRVENSVFSLVGRRPTPQVRRLADLPGVELVGEVADVREHYERAALTVAPLRVARGIQNKVLEALAMEKAVVGSPGALEGLSVTPGVHVLQASTTQQWVDHVCHLLDSPREAAQLGKAGRAYVEEHHRWDVCLQPFAELLNATKSHSVSGPAAARS